MSEKYKNKYRIQSTRLQNWDYGWDGLYFITICTKKKEHYFGEISDKKMELSQLGILADVFWHEIKNHAKNIELGDFIVMPNHIHGILILNNNNRDDNHNRNDNGNDNGNDNRRDKACLVSTTTTPMPPSSITNTTENKTIGQQRFQNQGKNTISSIIGSYKSAVSKHAHRLGFEFEWQTRFHDNIIRNEKSYKRIENYIKNNPENWENDKFYN